MYGFNSSPVGSQLVVSYSVLNVTSVGYDIELLRGVLPIPRAPSAFAPQEYNLPSVDIAI
jgi:hypothetical protein